MRMLLLLCLGLLFVVESLLDGALDAFKRMGQVPEENITIVRVPRELPSAKISKTGDYDAIVALAQ